MQNTRFEFKYTLNPAAALRARNVVECFMKPDPAAINNAYMVTSLYFDTPSLADYYDKLGGFLERKKIRARIYGATLREDTPEIWLEIKKKYDMSFRKERVSISQSDWQDLLNYRLSKLLSKERPPEKQRVVEEFIWYILQEGRKPMFWVRYKRYPYTSMESERIRVTFDQQLETSKNTNLYSPHNPSPIFSDTIMEVKFAHRLPAWFGTIIKQLNLQRDSYSKYARAVEAMHRGIKLPR